MPGEATDDNEGTDMDDQQFTIDDLRRILRVSAGVDEAVNLDDDIHDVEFTDLGFDSLVLLETASRIERECGITLDDSTITDALTPRDLLGVVNTRLSGSKDLVK
jgi:act minimal PKS acyl carrier protein